ncbi:UNVERIFIED_CONTAM: hypothetical protein K2H54_055582 [Gekko kuhli]
MAKWQLVPMGADPSRPESLWWQLWAKPLWATGGHQHRRPSTWPPLKASKVAECCLANPAPWAGTRAAFTLTRLLRPLGGVERGQRRASVFAGDVATCQVMRRMAVDPSHPRTPQWRAGPSHSGPWVAAAAPLALTGAAALPLGPARSPLKRGRKGSGAEESFQGQSGFMGWPLLVPPHQLLPHIDLWGAEMGPRRASVTGPDAMPRWLIPPVGANPSRPKSLRQQPIWHHGRRFSSPQNLAVAALGQAIPNWDPFWLTSVTEVVLWRQRPMTILGELPRNLVVVVWAGPRPPLVIRRKFPSNPS